MSPFSLSKNRLHSAPFLFPKCGNGPNARFFAFPIVERDPASALGPLPKLQKNTTRAFTGGKSARNHEKAGFSAFSKVGKRHQSCAGAISDAGNACLIEVVAISTFGNGVERVQPSRVGTVFLCAPLFASEVPKCP